MFKRIIVGTDGSLNAEKALQTAADLAKAEPDAQVEVVTAYRPLTPQQLNDIRASLPDEFRELVGVHDGADSALAKARQIFKAAGVEAKFHDFTGDPTNAILDAIERTNADVVVVGSRGEGIAGRALHGSVSTKLLHHAPCSVLVVRDD